MALMSLEEAAEIYMTDLNAHDLTKPEKYQHVVNAISDSMFKYLECKFTGKISVKAYRLYKKGRPKSKLCKEHFRPRTTVVRMIVDMFMNNVLTMNDLIEILDQSREINLVTSKENRTLAGFQRDGTLDYVEHYRQANVKLIDFVEIIKTKPFRITVGGISNVFQTKAEANKYGFSNKLLSSFKEDYIVIIPKKTNKVTKHLYKAGDEIHYERV